MANVARARRPGHPVILVTGHLDPLRERWLPNSVEFLQKPCDRTRLANLLRRALDGVPKPVTA